MKAPGKYRAVVMGASAGGLYALKVLLHNLDRNFSMPVIIVQHISPDADNYLVNILNDLKGIRVKEKLMKRSILNRVMPILHRLTTT